MPNAEYSELLARARTEITPVEFCGGIGDVLFSHALLGAHLPRRPAPAALLSLVPCASALLSFLRAARAVHSGGINEGDDVRLAIISDFQRLRPRGTLMWQVEGAQTPNVESSGVVQPDGVVPFPEEAGDPATLGDQRCEPSHRSASAPWLKVALALCSCSCR